MHPAYVEKLGFVVQIINISAKKINGTIFEIYEMMVTAFLVTDQADKVRFFEKTFLVANFSPNVVLGIFFLILSGADVDFLKRELWWRFYIIEKDFSTIKQIELVEKKVFAAIAIDLKHKNFVVHIAFLKSLNQEDDIYPFCKIQIAVLVANKALISIPTE